MKRLVLIFLFFSLGCFISCSNEDNPVTSSSQLFTVKVVDSNGDPVEGLRVGSINHPIGAGLDPDDFRFPRPCPETPIEFTLPEAGNWELTIEDYNGQLVKSYSGYADAGLIQIMWDGTDMQDEPVFSGFYHYFLVAGEYTDDKWMVLEKGPDPQQTIIGSLDNSGYFETDNIALFPGLINPQPISYYTDMVTIHLSNPDFSDDFFFYTTRLSPDGNTFSFGQDSLGLQEALVRITVVDTLGYPVNGIMVGSINHSYIEPTRKSKEPDGSIDVSFQLPVAGNVLLEIYDYYHNLVRILVDDYYSAGMYTITWDGKNDSGDNILCGYYEYELTSGDYFASKWLVYETGPDQPQTLGQSNTYGMVAVADTLYFPGLLGNPPNIMTYDELQNPLGYFHYTDSITFTLSRPDGGSRLFFDHRLTTGLNEFQLVWDPTELK